MKGGSYNKPQQVMSDLGYTPCCLTPFISKDAAPSVKQWGLPTCQRHWNYLLNKPGSCKCMFISSFIFATQSYLSFKKEKLTLL